MFHSLTTTTLFLLFATRTTTQATVIISEVADKGSSGVCGGSDWVEIFNHGPNVANLAGYVLHDDKGPLDADAFTFAAEGNLLEVGEYRLFCTYNNEQEGVDPSPQFGIGGDDTVTLLDNTGTTLSSVSLPGSGSKFDVSFAWNDTDSTYHYTSTPTPGFANMLTPVETADNIKARLASQNHEGTRFFGMDERGYPVLDGLDQVLELHITMDKLDYDYIAKNQSHEVFKPFQSARVLQNGNEIAFYSSPGRIRTKGQSTLYLGTCLNTTTIPYVIDMDYSNSSQTLFGVERLYLRNHMGDMSYMREWAAHRMLARFGLPYLRARKVRFYINGEKRGFYTLLEAPDQEYVFARSFPSYDPENYALFKVKTLSLGCGAYDEDQIEKAQSRVNETNTPPYEYQRGEHRNEIPVLGPFQFGECLVRFDQDIRAFGFGDVTLAYVLASTDCGAFLVKQGLVDRDLGVKGVEPTMAAFINEHLANNSCQPGCTNSDLAAQVDIENFLKNFAVYAVTVNQDSPLGNLNNYYLAETGDGTGWKIVPYDHNTASDPSCNPAKCNSQLVHWSIARPTCRSLESNQLVGPLLTNPALHAQYIEYIRSFVDTVAGNASFVEELMNHAAAIQDDVSQDFWSFGGLYYKNELSPEASDWSIDQLPFLPFMNARLRDVRAQLAAIDLGKYPRGPHVSQTPVEPWESCVDWRREEPLSACGTCQYEGCLQTSWTVPSLCDEETGTCYHGDVDSQCRGVPDGETYVGMENRDGRETFCFEVDGTPVKASVCPRNPDKDMSACGTCEYEGCLEPLWTVPAFCDEEVGICYHGDADEQCQGIATGERYDGIENRLDGRLTFCADAGGVPIKASECPPNLDKPSTCGTCEYEGCLEPSWTVPSFCNEENGVCYHFDFDANCSGVEIGGTYNGIKGRKDGRITFCSYWEGRPIKVSECPPKATPGTAPEASEDPTAMPSIAITDPPSSSPAFIYQIWRGMMAVLLMFI